MKIIDKKSLWEGTFLRAMLITYAESSASEGEACAATTIRTWESFERVNCDGVVAVVPITNNREVILIRQFRPPINGFVIELPAGLCDIGEPLERAAQRELVEETGYSAESLKFLIKGPMSSGASAEILNVFAATGLRHVGIGERDRTEQIEVLTIPLDRLHERLFALQDEGNCIDIKIAGLVHYAEKAIKQEKRSAPDS